MNQFQSVPGPSQAAFDALSGAVDSKIISTSTPTVQQLKDAKELIVWVASSDNMQHNAIALKEGYWNHFDLGVWTGGVYKRTYCQMIWNKTNAPIIALQVNSSELGNDVTVVIKNYILLM